MGVEVFDLSRPLDESTPVYRDRRGYSDPLTRVVPWVRVGERLGSFVSPFQVTMLQVGLHTGTHVDASAHFHPDGRTVSDLPASALVGRAVVVDVTGTAGGTTSPADLAPYQSRASGPDAMPLVIAPPEGEFAPDAVAEVVGWRRPLVLVAGGLDGADPDCPRTNALLGAGLWLVTDVDPKRARLVRDGDLLVVAPLPLVGVEGAPCRVLAVRGL